VRKTAVAFVLTLLLASAHARAECVVQTAKSIMAKPTIELVLGGEVIEITRVGDLGYRATFEVNRVWKGSVPKRFDLHVWELSPEMPRFEKGHRYVALAKTMTDPPVRQGLGLGATDAIAFTPTPCSDPPSLAPGLERDLGPGYAPKSDEQQRHGFSAGR